MIDHNDKEDTEDEITITMLKYAVHFLHEMAVLDNVALLHEINQNFFVIIGDTVNYVHDAIRTINNTILGLCRVCHIPIASTCKYRV